jgi:hypothetical protein
MKITHRALFLALQADAKKYPGGIRALGEALGLNGCTLANGLNPDHDCPPPTFSTVVEIILLAQGKQSIFQLCQLVNQAPVDIEMDDDQSEAGQIEQFLALVSATSDCLSRGSNHIKDGRFDQIEKREIAPLLLALIQVAAKLYSSVKE